MPNSIPLVDLGGNLDPSTPAAKTSALQLHEALSTIGFAYISGHTVRRATRDAAFAASREFHASTLEQKRSLAINAFHRGYMGMATSTIVTSSVAKVTRPNMSESLMSLNAGEFLTFPPQGISLRWFGALFANEAFMRAIGTSLQVAAIATVCSSVIGVAGALYVVRHATRLREGLRMMLMLPLMLPEILTAIALLFFLYASGIGTRTMFGAGGGARAGHAALCVHQRGVGALQPGRHAGAGRAQPGRIAVARRSRWCTCSCRS